MIQRIVWFLFVAVSLLGLDARADSPRQQAAEILGESGVTGGLVVHLGCGDGSLAAALGTDPEFLVQGLDRDEAMVAKARRHLRSLGIYGRVTADTLRGPRLPYCDNLINLLVAAAQGDVATDEMLRVLRPGGVALIRQGDRWTKIAKPWPDEIDEWTHYLHGPDNNAVAHDAWIDEPRHLRWLGEPKFARAHEQLASMSASVTTAGRLFYIIDEAPRADVRFPSQWSLVARDAFNGVVLWKRSIPTWVDQLRPFRSGPAETAFRLAAEGDRVYVTLGVEAPVSILDAVTGRDLATCEGTGGARQILRVGDKLVTLVDTRPQAAEDADSKIRRGLEPAPGSRAIVAADAQSGKTLWRIEVADFVHPTLAAEGDRLLYQTNEAIHCVDLADGHPLWQAGMQLELAGHELGWESPTLVVDDRTAYCADFKRLVAFSLDDGHQLWEAPSQAGYNSPPDVFLVGGLVWTRAKGMTGRDPATGEVKQDIATVPGYMHHRCYRNKATDRFFLLGIQGVQLVDRLAGDASPHHWIRGTCQYGIMPANGLLYVSPDSCACNMKSKLAGFWALASDEAQRPASADDAPRLEKGPAFGLLPSPAGGRGAGGEGAAAPPTSPGQSSVGVRRGTDWPVFRHDFARSGLTTAAVSADIAPAWRTKIGGRLSGVTVTGGKLFVAAVDENTIYALDEKTGTTAWTFTAGGRIDSPPTVYEGTALFGSADGWVYAVDAADGRLAWRFRAAPEERRTYVNGQLESVWPVHGSVLVHDGQLIVAAGRSSYIDGGIRLLRLDPASGRLLSETTVFSPDPETGRQPKDANVKDVRGLLSDILVADGPDVYMRQVKLDLATGSETGTGVHLFCPVGLLDDTWWHRAYWVFHDEFIAHWSGWWKVGNYVPSGRILSYDATSIFGYGRDKYPSGNIGQWRGGEQYRLFACDRPPAEKKPAASQQAAKKGRRGKTADPPPVENRWEARVPFYVRAMVVAGDTVFIAGPPELVMPIGTGQESLVLTNPEETVDAWQGADGGQLWAVSTGDGSPLAKYQLDAPPVFDGMAAADGRLFMAATDGSVVCFGK